jgi:hypothetical protein
MNDVKSDMTIYIPIQYNTIQFIDARRITRKGKLLQSDYTFPKMCPDLVEAHTKFILVHVLSYTIPPRILVG